MEAAEEIVISNQLVLLAMVLVFGTATSFMAYRLGFFSFKGEKGALTQKLRFTQVLGAFGFFLSVQLVILPAVVVTYIVIKTGQLPDRGLTALDTEVQGWINVATMVVSFLVVMGYYQFQNIVTKNFIWQRGVKKKVLANLRSFVIGVSSWFVAYPIVFFIGQGISLLVYILIGEPEIEQVAVKSLKITEEYPILYSSMVISMILLVPIMEELLFRGFLQSWLRGKMRLSYAILCTSIVFALFHLSYSQGISNIQYVVALLLLSGFLGYLYEREESLWAPIGLHVMFNAISIFIISLS